MNNAGIYIGKPFTELTAEDYAAVMNVNVAGFYHITQLAIAAILFLDSAPFITGEILHVDGGQSAGR